MNKNAPKIELWSVHDIHPYDKNAKIHTENQIAHLVQVIKSQGWDVPIVVDKDGVIIKGHGRRLAALSMGLEQVPVIVRRDLTEAQVKAARLSDNRVAMGDFDVDAIKEELDNLKNDGFDLTTMGFDEKEITMMLGDLDSMDFDALQDKPEASQSTPAATEVTEATPTEPALKPVLASDLLGFKHVPGEYKGTLVSFQALAEEGTGKQGAEAFCIFVQKLLDGMTAKELSA